jgi:hypothetical protein
MPAALRDAYLTHFNRRAGEKEGKQFTSRIRPDFAVLVNEISYSELSVDYRPDPD